MNQPDQITELLVNWSQGDREALDELLPKVEVELRRIAKSHIRRMNPGNTFQTTALINETYLKLVDQNRVTWQNRAHFFGISAQIMRRILLNYFRDKKRIKRGAGVVHESLSNVAIKAGEKSDEVIALDGALVLLEKADERKGKVVELRYFGGLSVQETAEVLGVSEITVNRDWNFAKAFLAKAIRDGS